MSDISNISFYYIHLFYISMLLIHYSSASLRYMTPLFWYLEILYTSFRDIPTKVVAISNLFFFCYWDYPFFPNFFFFSWYSFFYYWYYCWIIDLLFKFHLDKIWVCYFYSTDYVYWWHHLLNNLAGF